MKLIKPSVEIIKSVDYGLLPSVLRHIERCGGVCYKSEDKINNDSAHKFVEMLIKKGHLAMLEHGTICLTYPHKENDASNWNDILRRYRDNPYSKVKWITGEPNDLFITTNYRVLVENGWEEDLIYSTNCTPFHEPRISVRFVCDRGVSHELVRHRVFSFAQESTRFCNYSKDKFNNEITFILPCWLDRSLQSCSDFKEALNIAEQGYFELLKQGWQPQQARAVLPNALKTEIVMTGFLSDWQGKIHVYKTDDKTYNQVRPWSPEVEKMVRDQYRVKDNLSFQLSGFFPLRTALSAHPQMRELAIPLYEMFKEKFKI